MHNEVFICTPYSSKEKNLGKAYNEFMRLMPYDAWVCFHDIDFMFLTPDAGRILHEYTKRVSDQTVLTCLASRAHELSKDQLLNGKVSQQKDIEFHIRTAQDCKKNLYQLSPVNHDLSGFLILMNKVLWEQIPFSENRKCLGVDTDLSRALKNKGIPLLCMNGLYGWHTYRLTQGVSNTNHLL